MIGTGPIGVDNLMIRKNLIVTSVLVLGVLLISSMGALSAYACSVDSFSTTNSTTSYPTATDSATIKLTYDGPFTGSNECSGDNGFGCIIFKVYTVPTSGPHAGIACNSYGNPYGTQVTGDFPAGASQSSIPVTSAAKGSSHSYTSDTLTTTSLSGKYVWIATYTGTNKGDSINFPSATADCEPFTVTPSQPPPGVPQFPLGALGMFALIGMMLPLLYVMRAKFARNVAI